MDKLSFETKRNDKKEIFEYQDGIKNIGKNKNIVK